MASGATNKTPASLLLRLRTPGDQEAWERFVKIYWPMIYRWARRAGLDPHAADDLVQEILAILVRKLAEFRYDPQQSFRAWLKTVTLNKWHESQRRQLRTEGGADARAALAQAESPDLLAPFEEDEYRRQVLRRVMKVVREDFETVTWDAFWRYAVQGKPVGQVAASLGLTPNAVYLAKSRVLGRLRAELEGLVDLES